MSSKKILSKLCFTLAGTRWLDRYTGSRSELLFRHKKAAFTLAEVLITLAIIGVVAAITIPSLMALIGSKSDSARKEVIEDRLLDGLNRYSAMEDGLSLHYNTTKEFLDGLSKYYKMSQICDSDEITKCVPYEKINFEDGDEIKSVDVSSLTTTAALISGEAAENYLPPASFITSQGTPVIIALKKGCTQDMGKAMTSIQTAGEGGCIALMYDKNGTGLPNRIGKDIVNLGMTVTSAASGSGETGGTPSGSGAALKTINGVKVMETVFFPETGLTKSQCLEEVEKQSEYSKFETPIKNCNYEDDRWAAAMKYCKEKGYHLPSEAESLKLVKGLFKDANGNHPTSTSWSSSTYKIDMDAVNALGLKYYDGSNITQDHVYVGLWLGKENDSYGAYCRSFGTSGTLVDYYASRDGTNRQAVCLGD